MFLAPLLVAWSATCGTINSSGVYVAPASGTCRVMARVGTVADTSLVTVLIAPPDVRPLVVGFWEYPTTLCNGSGVTGSARTRSTTNLLEHLQTAKRCGVRVVIAPNRDALTTTGTTKAPFSLDSAKAYDTKLAQVLVPDTLAKYQDVLVGLNLADDYGSTDQWGGTTVSPAQIEAWAKDVRAKIPSLRLGVRVEATWVTQSLAVQLDYAWAQYHKGKGDPATYFNRQAATARALGLSLVTGLNTTHCAGAGSTFCTPAEVRLYMGMAVQRPESCGAWAWDYDLNQMAVTGMTEAWAEVLALAAQRPEKACTHLW